MPIDKLREGHQRATMHFDMSDARERNEVYRMVMEVVTEHAELYLSLKPIVDVVNETRQPRSSN